MKTIAFLGAGNMGGAIIRSVCGAGKSDRVIITDYSVQKAVELAQEVGCEAAEGNVKAAMAAKFVLLAVKPQVIESVIEEIAPYLTDEQVLVSIAAGVTIKSISEKLARFGKSLPIIRLLPNTPAAIGKGLVLVVPSPDTEKADLEELIDLLRPCGRVEKTSENYADAIMVIGGCTPAFTYMFIEALADGAVMTGLPRADALTFAAQTVMGAAAMVLESGKHPGELKDAVCSPAGSTIEGVNTLEKGAFRASVMDAVINAWHRTVQLGK